ncbi:MAG: MFS transporter [Spirochaetaceae bacterium]|nr:MFS transporter [Spirochaetaceae bacterium]
MQSRATPPADVFNLGVLGVAQALGLSAMSMMIFIGGIVGRGLAPRPALATLPLALVIIGLAATTIPAALLARRLGRRRAFIIGALLATAAALVLALAVSRGSFALFCGAAVVLGMNGAFVQQYRFAAAESATPEYAGRAVAYVLVGGMMGGVLGPEVARRSRHLLEAEFAGGFLVLAALLALLALVVSRLRDNGARFAAPPPHRTPVAGAPPEVRSAAASRLLAPGFGVAILAAAVAYAVMSSIMTATPLHLNAAGLPLDRTAIIIQSHVIAMYLPSLASGYIMDRLGVARVLLVGVAGMTASVVVGVYAASLPAFWAALVLLGLGWNMLFLGGTVLLARTAAGAERFRLQAINDFGVFGAQALASLSAGSALVLVGWDALNLAALPLLAWVAITVLVRRTALSGTAQRP